MVAACTLKKKKLFESSKMKRKLSKETLINHNSYIPPAGFRSYAEPVYRGSTVLFRNLKELRSRFGLNRDGYAYGLHGTPTTYTLEAELAAIEGGNHALLASSGLSAISLVDMAFLKTGDDMLIPDNAYNPTQEMGRWLAQDFGVSVRFYDPMIGAGIADLIQENTKLIWTEVPGSITMEIPDLPAISKAAHEKGVVVALDNTWSAGLVYDGFAHGADVIVQAVTKYQGGASDLLMGAVIMKDDELFRKVGMARIRLGIGVGADDVALVLRSLPSMKLRFEKSGASSLIVADWLKGRPEVDKILHPAYPDCPGHEFYKRDFTGTGGLFSFLFDGKYTGGQIDRFIESLTLFGLGYSWGGTHSLAVPYAISDKRIGWKLPQRHVVRLYIGLDDPQDLIADLEQAMAKM